MEIRHLAAGELDRLAEVDVSEEGSANYRLVDGRLEAFAHAHRRPPLSVEYWRPDLDEWRTFIEEGGGKAFGAFLNAALVGFAILRDRLTDDTAQLAALYVDRAHRRRGIAGALVDRVEEEARAAGRRRLYVSAVPSDSAVPFYLSAGFAPVADPHPALLAREPDDIHMAKPLVGTDHDESIPAAFE